MNKFFTFIHFVYYIMIFIISLQGPKSKTSCLVNVLKIGLLIESKKLPIHCSLVKPMVEPRLNWRRHKYILNIYQILKYHFKKKISM